MAADGTSSAAAASGEAFTLEEALALRQQGNEHFKQGQFVEACGCYRRALDDVRRFEALPAATGGSCSDLSAAVRLNLVACLVREEFGEVDTALALCNEVLSQDRDCAKALFRRGQVWLSKSGKCQDQASRRDCLSSARADLLQVAKATPGDKDVRSLLEQITEALKETAPATSSRSGSGLFQGLYSDKDRQEPPPPPVICSTCGRIGHPACGKAWWISQRAKWLGVEEDDVASEPGDFEEDGALREAIADARKAAGNPLSMMSERCIDDELSDSEREAMEDCLESTERPYLQPKKPLPLALAVQCAEDLWVDS
eukprot:TRINITY_DN30190_c0_g1_i1.p1 TRINITY_DN30190_c0_g1~~TRINITY_DN30190_c0_g1_i1.p1  ORF type:complete len:314 (-),score=64.05 TRINITY_DN30190_c0_g1_i1:96-1037(-)